MIHIHSKIVHKELKISGYCSKYEGQVRFYEMSKMFTGKSFMIMSGPDNVLQKRDNVKRNGRKSIVKPIIDRTFAFAQIGDAHSYVERNNRPDGRTYKLQRTKPKPLIPLSDHLSLFPLIDNGLPLSLGL